MKKLFVLIMVFGLVFGLGLSALAAEVSESAGQPAADGLCSHEANYSVLDNDTRLSAICGKCRVSLGEFRLLAPTRTVYNDSGSEMASYVNNFAAEAQPDSIAVSYEGVNGTSYGPSSTAPTDAGSYKVFLYFVSGRQMYTLFRTYTIDKTEFNIGVSGLPRSFDYINETVTVDTGTGAAEPVIVLRPQQADNKNAPDTGITLENGACISDYTGMQMFYIVTASDNYKASNTYHTLQVPARPAAPAGLAGTGESFDGFDDGKISRVNDTMEYKLQGAESWTAVPAGQTSLTGLADGSYLVRYKATDSSFASEAAMVTIARGGVPTRELSIAADDIETTYGAQAWTSLKITNSGNCTATITSVTLSGENADIYDLLRWDDPSDTVAPGATNETWFIRFKSTDIETGTYNCTVTVTYDNGATATKEITAVVKKIYPIRPSHAPVIIDYAAETICVDSAAPAEPVWAVGTSVEDSVPIGEGKRLSAWLDAEGGTIIYISAAESKNYLASFWAFREVLQRPAALSLAVHNETVDGKNDGEILLPDGINSPVEYSADGGQTWTDVPGVKLEGLSDGSYLVRLKATDGSFAGETAEVTVAKGVPPVYDFAFSGGCFDTFYNSAWARTLTITNTGNMPLTNARLSVEGTDAEKMFRIGEKIADLAVGQSGEWSQSYVGRMNAGSYDLTLVLTADNNVRIEKEITFVIRQSSQLPPDHLTLQYPWGKDWIAYEKQESSHGAPIEYSFDGGQTWITGTPDPEDPNRLIIRGLTPDTHYSVDFRYGPSPDGNYAPSEKWTGTSSFGFTTMHEVGITQGGGQTYYLGSDEDLLFVSSDKFEHFRYLYVYPKGADMSTVDVLDRSFYMAEEGSVRLTLKAEYLNSLPAGEYVIEIPCNDRLGEGEAIASFFVKEMPAGGGSSGSDDTEGDVVKTGDSRQAGLWAALVLVCAAAAAALLIAKKKKRH